MQRGSAELSGLDARRCVKSPARRRSGARAALVALREPALPAPLFARLARAVGRVGAENLRATYQTTFWFDLGGRPASLVEVAALELLRWLSPAARRRVAGVEWWLSRMYTPDVRVDFHRDHDIRRADRGGGMAHPVISSVLFLNRVRGGLLAVTAEPPDPENPSCAPDRLDRMDLVRPWPNRFATFDGSLTHGVLDDRNRVPGDGGERGSRRGRMRRAIILNWWASRPWGVPAFAERRLYRALALPAAQAAREPLAAPGRPALCMDRSTRD